MLTKTPSSKKIPRISINKLAEYLEANTARRKKIVMDAKYPANFIVTRYKEAREAIKDYINSNGNEDFILSAIEILEAKKPDTEFQEQDIKLSIEALTSFLDFDITPLFDSETISYDDDNKYVKIEGVNVSVNPDLIVKKNVGGIIQVGAIKLHISKSNQLNPESQKIVSVMLNNYVSEHIIKKGQTANPKLNFSFDVFKQSFETCPNSIKLRLRQIEAACEEIVLWWDKL